jgi:hypothetical protein
MLTQEVHFLLEHPQAAWCNFAGDFYGKQVWQQFGCAPLERRWL